MKAVIGIIAAVVVIGAVGAFALSSKDDKPEQTANTTTQTADNQNMSNMDMSSQEQNSADESASETSQSNAVVMNNLSFSPAKITVKKGTTVTWTNQDDVQHDVNPDNPTEEFKKSALFGKGGTYSVTFNTPGTYAYHCTPHPFMKGTVEVTE